jgi:hypothetical protein
LIEAREWVETRGEGALARGFRFNDLAERAEIIS